MMYLPIHVWATLVACLLVGSSACWFCTWGILRLVTVLGVNSRRDLHHSHKAPISRWGGLGLVAAFLGVALVILLSRVLTPAQVHILGVVMAGSLATFALGFWDDLRSLDARWKLLAQVLIASAVYFSDIRIDILKNPLTDSEFILGASSYFATVLWLITLTNLINLIDGIDGLAGGICVMLMFLLATLGESTMGLTTLLSVGMGAALLGFLWFNYPPAKIYMGDGGAYFLGFLIGILSIVNSNKGTVVAALIAPAFALALPLADVSLAVMRRGLRGLPLFRPDQKHIHHHLISLGFSRERAVLVLYTVSMVCLLLAFSVFYCQGRLLPLFTGLLFLVLLVSGHLSGFTKDWITLGSGVSRSLALRKETRYAMALSSWLEMEVERHESVEELWLDYQFVIRKLGFSRVKIVLPDRTSIWEHEELAGGEVERQHACQQTCAGATIEFTADHEAMSAMLFHLLSDLASETWHKAAARWKSINKTPMEFTSRAERRGDARQTQSIHRFAHSRSRPHVVPA